MAALPRRMNLFYWAPTHELWGHCSLALSDGTHISWWPMTEPGEGKKHPGLVPIALFTEWINAYQNQTLAKDTEYEGRQPAVLAIPVGLNEGAIKSLVAKIQTITEIPGCSSQLFNRCISSAQTRRSTQYGSRSRKLVVGPRSYIAICSCNETCNGGEKEGTGTVPTNVTGFYKAATTGKTGSGPKG